MELMLAYRVGPAETPVLISRKECGMYHHLPFELYGNGKPAFFVCPPICKSFCARCVNVTYGPHRHVGHRSAVRIDDLPVNFVVLLLIRRVFVLGRLAARISALLGRRFAGQDLVR